MVQFNLVDALNTRETDSPIYRAMYKLLYKFVVQIHRC